MNYNETLDTLSKFYAECMKFWIREGKNTNYAIDDIEQLKHDPYSPNGRKLDEDAKNDFVNYLREVWEQ